MKRTNTVTALTLIGSSLIAGSAVFAPQAVAQELIEAGSVIQRVVPQGQAHCFLLPTTRGSRWRVSLSGGYYTVLEVGRGDCATLVVDQSKGDITNVFTSGSRIDFAAGGGGYTLRAKGLGGAGVNYVLRVEALPGVATNGLLPEGSAVGPWMRPGWTPDSVSAAPANAGEDLAAGNVFKDCPDVCPEMVVVPPGAFTMGSTAEETGRDPSEGPRHPVALVNAFAMGRYEVTFAEYDACVAEGGCTHRPNDQGWGRGRRPVVDVSWNDAQAYVVWLSAKTGQRYALPSESEWEYAARSGSDTPWQTGRAILTDDANILNAFARTVAVGAYPPNRFGLHDAHGNAAEWVLDCLDTGYIGVPNDGSAATAGDCATNRLIRGGYFGSEPTQARFATRNRGNQTVRAHTVGFRVTRAL